MDLNIDDLIKKLKVKTFGKYKVVLKLPEIKNIDELMEFDKKYFINNPESNEFVRPVTEYDFSDIVEHQDKVKYVLVRQILPGVRVRTYFDDITFLN